MDNSSVTVEAEFMWTFQYVTEFEIWLKAGLPQFSHCKYHKHSMVCGRRRTAGKCLF